MVTDRKPHFKGRVDVIFKNGPDIIKQKLYVIDGLYGKSLYDSIFDARFFARTLGWWPLGNARAKASNRCRFYARVALF